MGIARFLRMTSKGDEYHGGLLALVGQVVTAVSMDADDQHYMTYETPAGSLHVSAVGDCCSESWFYHVLGVKHLVGHTVQRIEYLEMEAPDDGLSRQDHDELYGYNLITEVGVCNVEFRNSSNGYYGGWLQAVKRIPAGVRMVRLTDDYTAQLYGGTEAA